MKRLDVRQDEGTTLVELLIGMTLMGVFLTIFASLILTMSNTANSVQTVSATSSQVSVAFTRIDKELRYAASISTPSSVANANGNWYVEYQTSNTGTNQCTQLQLSTSTKVLSKRTWVVSSAGVAGSPTTFAPMAVGVTVPTTSAGGSGYPFSLLVNQNFDLEQLAVSLSSTGTGTTRGVASSATVTFTANNSAVAETSAEADSSYPSTTCNQKGRP